jgi:Ca2+-transporting ATPase
MTEEKEWYRRQAEDTLSALKSGRQGLNQPEAQKRLGRYGANELAEERRISPWALFLRQFKSFLIIILLIAVVL